MNGPIENKISSLPTLISPLLPMHLGPDDVLIWYADLNRAPFSSEEYRKLLSIDEIERSHRFCFEHDRRSYIICRGILRTILGHYLGVRPEEISFFYNHFGKPMLESNIIHFNVSKSEGKAIFVISRNRFVGVDIEKTRAVGEIDCIARRFFSRTEYDFLLSKPESERQKTFYKFWTRKEALVKAIGEGLSIPLHTVDVSSFPDEHVRFISVEGTSGKDCGWTIYDLRDHRGFASAVAIEGTFCPPLRMQIFYCFEGEAL